MPPPRRAPRSPDERRCGRLGLTSAYIRLPQLLTLKPRAPLDLACFNITPLLSAYTFALSSWPSVSVISALQYLVFVNLWQKATKTMAAADLEGFPPGEEDGEPREVGGVEEGAVEVGDEADSYRSTSSTFLFNSGRAVCRQMHHVAFAT